MLKRSSPSFCIMTTKKSSFMSAKMDWEGFDEKSAGGPPRKKTKLKKVSWSAPVYQVRFFRSEDEPRRAGSDLELSFHRSGQLPIGVASRPHLEVKLQNSSHKGRGSRHRPVSILNPAVVAAAVPQVAWRCPDRFELSEEWSVMAGDASEEVAEQIRRESTALEAVYPRPSSIPDSPAEASDEGMGPVNDDKVMMIPLVPTEDDEEEIVADEHQGMHEVQHQEDNIEAGKGGASVVPVTASTGLTLVPVAVTTGSACTLSVAATPQHAFAKSGDLLVASPPAPNPLAAPSPSVPLPAASAQAIPVGVLSDPVVQKEFVCAPPLQLAAPSLLSGDGDVGPDILAASAVVFAALATSNSAQAIDPMLLTQMLSHSEVLGRTKGEIKGGSISVEDLLAKLAAKLPLANAGLATTPVPPNLPVASTLMSTNPPPPPPPLPIPVSTGLSQQELASRLVRAFGVASPQPPVSSFLPGTIPNCPPCPELLPLRSVTAEVRVFPSHQHSLPVSSRLPLRPPVVNPPLPPGPPPPQVKLSFNPPPVVDAQGPPQPPHVHVLPGHLRPPPPNVLQSRPPSNEQWVGRPPFPPLPEGQARMNSGPGPFCRPAGYMQVHPQLPHGWGHEHESSSMPNSYQNDGKSVPENSARRQKSCLFFNTPQGCRNGVNCTFLHSSASSTMLTASVSSYK